MRESKLLECKGLGTRRCFSKVSESRHSPLVLIGAPAQGCSSLLIHARIKWSLRADSLTLRRDESPTTAHKMSWVIHKLYRMITKLPITTKPSRWWWSPRVTSKNSHLTTTSLMRRWMHTCYSLITSEDSQTWNLKTQFSLWLFHFLAQKRSFSADKISKSASNGGVEEVFILPINSPNRYLWNQQLSWSTDAMTLTDRCVCRSGGTRLTPLRSASITCNRIKPIHQPLGLDRRWPASVALATDASDAIKNFRAFWTASVNHQTRLTLNPYCVYRS
jgi:hypothetical protein